MIRWEFATLTYAGGQVIWTVVGEPKTTERQAAATVVFRAAQAGQDGWELVQVLDNQWFFKRPLPDS